MTQLEKASAACLWGKRKQNTNALWKSDYSEIIVAYPLDTFI